MVSPYRFHVDQRVQIRRRGGGRHRQPPESIRGALGVIAPQMTDDWSGTKLELEAGIPNVYYVTLDNGDTELIAEDWLEDCSGGCATPSRPSIQFPQLKRRRHYGLWTHRQKGIRGRGQPGHRQGHRA